MSNIEIPEVIVCAAIKGELVAPDNARTEYILLGTRHYDPLMQKTLELLPFEFEEIEQGFMTNKRRFVGRKEAKDIAKANLQVRRWSSGGRESNILFSEDLY